MLHRRLRRTCVSPAEDALCSCLSRVGPFPLLSADPTFRIKFERLLYGLGRLTLLYEPLRVFLFCASSVSLSVWLACYRLHIRCLKIHNTNAGKHTGIMTTNSH